MTLREAFSEFLKARTLKPSTLRNYKRAITCHLGDWLERPIASISRDMVAKRHVALRERGGPTANHTMRALRSVLNFAAATYEDEGGHPILLDNPVSRLSEAKLWSHVGRRENVIEPHEFPAWYEAVQALALYRDGKAKVVRDYLLFLLFTGLRREEAARLRWQDVDLKSRTFTVPDTKNGDPLTLPLATVMLELLKPRRREGVVGYVFPGSGTSGHLVEPRRQIEWVRERSGVQFTLHDLRRTFLTVAESLDIGVYALKRLVNHRVGTDVTAGYIVHSPERLREPAERVASKILELTAATSDAGGATSSPTILN